MKKDNDNNGIQTAIRGPAITFTGDPFIKASVTLWSMNLMVSSPSLTALRQRPDKSGFWRNAVHKTICRFAYSVINFPFLPVGKDYFALVHGKCRDQAMI
jgi:hypothetical protein